MIYLELAMLAIGIAAVVFSYRLVKEETALSPDEEREAVIKKLQDMIKEFEDKAETVSEDMEDKMGQMSNEKIMGINEYSEQVLDKIDKTHEEVVFLYNMMNEKQDEMKSLIHDVDSQKAELRDEAVVQYQKMKEQEQVLEQMKKEIEVDFLQFQSERGKFREEFERLKEEYSDLEKGISVSMKSIQNSKGQDGFDAVQEGDQPAEDDFSADGQVMPTEDTSSENDFVIQAVDDMNLSAEPENSSDFVEEDAETVSLPSEGQDMDGEDFSLDAASVFDAEVTRIEEEEMKEQERNGSGPSNNRETFSSGYTPLSEQEKMENHNDEIVSLYKKGRSVLEISKMLSLGQGEVKFVIDLYNARV